MERRKTVVDNENRIKVTETYKDVRVKEWERSRSDWRKNITFDVFVLAGRYSEHEIIFHFNSIRLSCKKTVESFGHRVEIDSWCGYEISRSQIYEKLKCNNVLDKYQQDILEIISSSMKFRCRVGVDAVVVIKEECLAQETELPRLGIE